MSTTKDMLLGSGCSREFSSVSACCPLNRSDERCGSVELMRTRSPAQFAAASPSTVDRWFKELESTPQFKHEFNPVVPRTNGWRMTARLCSTNTSIKHDSGIRKDLAIELTKGLLGSKLCAPESTLRKSPAGGFWVIAIALSLMLRRIVTPQRAVAMFSRKTNHSYGITSYGSSLLERFSLSWPPCPHFSQFNSKTVRTTLMVDDHGETSSIMATGSHHPSAQGQLKNIVPAGGGQQSHYAGDNAADDVTRVASMNYFWNEVSSSGDKSGLMKLPEPLNSLQMAGSSSSQQQPSVPHLLLSDCSASGVVVPIGNGSASATEDAPKLSNTQPIIPSTRTREATPKFRHRIDGVDLDRQLFRAWADSFL